MCLFSSIHSCHTYSHFMCLPSTIALLSLYKEWNLIYSSITLPACTHPYALQVWLKLLFTVVLLTHCRLLFKIIVPWAVWMAYWQNDHMGRTLLQCDPFMARITMLWLIFINNPKHESIVEVCLEQWKKIMVSWLLQMVQNKEVYCGCILCKFQLCKFEIYVI